MARQTTPLTDKEIRVWQNDSFIVRIPLIQITEK